MLLTLIAGLIQMSSAEDWKYRPLVKPIISYQSFSTTQDRYNGMNVGGALGVKYTQKKTGLKMMGMTRAQYIRTIGPNGVYGEDVRVGSFIGPWWRIVGVQGGVDVSRNTYFNDAISIPQVYGITPTLSGLIDLRVVTLSAAAGPTSFAAGERDAVDWTKQYDFPGFGDEFFYSAQAGLDLLLINLGVNYTHRFTAYGEENYMGVGISLF